MVCCCVRTGPDNKAHASKQAIISNKRRQRGCCSRGRCQVFFGRQIKSKIIKPSAIAFIITSMAFPCSYQAHISLVLALERVERGAALAAFSKVNCTHLILLANMHCWSHAEVCDDSMWDMCMLLTCIVIACILPAIACILPLIVIHNSSHPCCCCSHAPRAWTYATCARASATSSIASTQP